MDCGYFNIVMHHGGQFVGENFADYVGGEVAVIKDCNGNIISLVEIVDMVRKLGYRSFTGMWFRPPQNSLELLPLNTYMDICALTGYAFGEEEVHIYVVHELNVAPNPLEVIYNGVMDFDKNGDDSPFESRNEDDKNEGEHAVEVYDCGDINFDWDMHNSDTDDMHSIVDSDDEEGGVREQIFGYNYDPKNVKFKLGMLLPSIELFKRAVTDYAVYNNRNVKFKSEKTKLRAWCEKPCEWLIYGSTIDNGRAVQIKTFIDSHTCPKSYRIRNMSSKWLANNFVSMVRSQPDVKTTTIQSEVTERYGVGCTRSKAFRARQLALKMFEGDYAQQYGLVHDYCEEVMKSNPGSTCVVQCSVPDHIGTSTSVAPTFRRLYMCLYACKKGFVDGCRPLIGIDGCHLKGPCGGILLSAVAMDPNHRVFQIAIATVESENKDSWGWFLDLLLDDIGSDRQWTFISDQQKGLVPALAERGPNLEHRLCVRHLHGNLKKQHSGLLLKELMYAAANSTYSQTFQANMQRIKDLNRGAYDWLSKIDPKSWTKSAFSSNAKNDTITNNLSESYNAIILYARDKPIITMLEALRRSLMLKFQSNREQAKKWKGRICPHFAKKVEKLKKDVNGWITRFAGDDQFEVSGPYNQYKVDTNMRTCSCRRWNLTGIPCVHAVAAMFHKEVSSLEYVDDCYSIDAYKACYANMIYPINGRDMWPRSSSPRPLPPVYGRPPGRPKKVRKRESEEAPPQADGRLSRKNRKMKCRLCNEFGHNKRGCNVKKQKEQDNANNSNQHRVPAKLNSRDVPVEQDDPIQGKSKMQPSSQRRRISSRLHGVRCLFRPSVDPNVIDLTEP